MVTINNSIQASAMLNVPYQLGYTLTFPSDFSCVPRGKRFVVGQNNETDYYLYVFNF